MIEIKLYIQNLLQGGKQQTEKSHNHLSLGKLPRIFFFLHA